MGRQLIPTRQSLVLSNSRRFRWVQLSLDNLGAQRTARSIREALRKLPGTLRETYANILERIAPDDCRLVRLALFWLSFAYRPLKLVELSEAVVIDLTSTVMDDDMRLVSPQILLQISQGLITRDKSGNITLAHSSVKDFLISEWIRTSRVRRFSLDPSTANQTIMRVCLTYLCLDNFRSGYASSKELSWQRVKAYPFLKYAAQFWALHGRSCTLWDRDLQLVSRLFNTRRLSRRGNFGVWVQTLIPYGGIANIDVTQPLYYAASFGLDHVVKAILASDSDLDIDAPGGRSGASALFIACWRGNYDIADILVQAGADTNFTDKSTGWSVRRLALKDGHVFPCVR